MDTSSSTFKQIALKNILSFGESSRAISLNRLNVLIGPNGSGKSNLIEALGLFHSLPKDLADAIRIGGGTRIKILEAMAHRKPVVSTSIGAEGLDLEPEKHLLIADSPAEFASACIRLLRNRELRQTLITSAFEQVSSKYDWSNIQNKVTQIVLQNGVDAPIVPQGNLFLEQSA